MSSRRKAKQERKARMQAEKSKTKPFWKRAKLWAGIALVCAAGAFAAGRLAREPETASPKAAFDSKQPASEGIVGAKRKLYLNLFTHDTDEQIVCYLKSALERFKPKQIFMENAGLPAEDADRIESTLNDPGIADSALPFAQKASLILQREHRRRTGMVLHTAESYTVGERKEDIAEKNKNAHKARMELAHSAFVGNRIGEAVELRIEAEKLLAGYIRFRNDRISETVSRGWTESLSDGMITVGGGHKNLKRIFEDMGYDVALVNELEALPLASHYEAVSRGWKPKPGFDERSESARELLCTEAAGRFVGAKVTTFEPAFELCLRKVPSFTVEKLGIVHENGPGKFFSTLKVLGHPFPENRLEFEKVMREMKICY